MGKNIVALRPFREEDIELMERWLKTPHAALWYKYPEHWLREIRERHGDFSFLTHFIAESGGLPFGFCQYYDCFFAEKHEIWNKVWYTGENKGESYAIDYLIGEKDFLQKGFGKSMIKQLLKTIWQETKAKEVVVEPEKENNASNKTLESVGFAEIDGKYIIKRRDNL